MKATGIMLMVLAHCSNFELLYRIVYSFHMPLFFIVSGYCFKEKYLHEPISFMWKRIKGLWWPYVKWGLFFLLLHNVFIKLNIYGERCNQHLYSRSEYLVQAENILFHMYNTEPFPGGFWFIRALFFGSLIACLIIKVGDMFAKLLGCDYKKICVLGGAFSLLLWVSFNYLHMTFTALYIGPTELMAASFFIVGHNLAIWNMPRFSPWLCILAFGIMAVNSFFSLIDPQGPFYDTHKIIPYTITAVMGTWCVYSLPWQQLKGRASRLMEYVGNHTLVILTWHFLCFKIVSIIIIAIYGLPIERLTEIPALHEYTNRGWFIIYFLVGMLFPILKNKIKEWVGSNILTD